MVSAVMRHHFLVSNPGKPTALTARQSELYRLSSFPKIQISLREIYFFAKQKNKATKLLSDFVVGAIGLEPMTLRV